MAIEERDLEAAESGMKPAGDRKRISVSGQSVGGARGFVAAWKSLATGMAITAKHAFTKPVTLQYPREKAVMPERWRGTLHLRGTLGTDPIPLMTAPSPDYNGAIDAAYAAGRLAPCQGNCPANVDARGQNYHLAEGRAAEAYMLVRDRNVLPGVLGRICHHPCETACRRNYYDEPVAIRPLHRVAYEGWRDVKADYLAPLPKTQGKNVAVVGSGPSGLAAALDLMKLGYGVTVYEKDTTPGGALNTGVPSYRLPREVLHEEIDDLVAMGMELHCGVEIGEDVPLDHLVGEFDAVLIAAGLQTSRRLPIPGADADGVRGALEFLRAANFKGDAGVRGKRVLVIGGGNVAVDVARCAIRVGASEVRLSCLEGDGEMPCHPWEIEEALEEGLIAMCGQGPEAVLTDDDGKVRGMRLRSCLSVFDAGGRFAPQFGDDYTEFETDVVVFSIGQASDLTRVVAGSDLRLDERGNLPVDGSVFTTAVDGVFACGEVVTGPGSCIGSIATGHEAATSIHRYLSGESLTEGRVARPVPRYDKYENAVLDDVEQDRRRVTLMMAPAEERARDFRAVEFGMTHLEGLMEASRCLRCQSEVCVGCGFCARTCPDYAIRVERVDDPDGRCLTRYELDLTKCCFCGLCAEQCPTDALAHTGEYELSFYHRDLMMLDKSEMRRDPGGSRTTGADARATVPCPQEPNGGAM